MALEKWSTMFKDNKWCFVAYTGQETRINTSRWYTLKTGPWVILRHQLESFGAEMVESADTGSGPQNPYNGRPHNMNYIKAYLAFKPGRILDHPDKFPQDLKNLLKRKNIDLPQVELKSKDYIMPNYFIYLVRYPMPLGGRSYIPIEEKAAYAVLQHEKTLGYKVEDRIKVLEEENSEKIHASDLEIKFVEFNNAQYSTNTLIQYLVPPKDYFCMECETFGLHFKEACFLWPKEIKEVGLAVGPKKFKKSLEVSEEDAIHFNLLYKRTKL